MQSSTNARLRPLLLHSALRSFIHLCALQTLDSALENLHSQKRGAARPQRPGESSEDSIGACSGANRAAAEEKFTEEGSERDEAGEVEEGV